MVSTKIEPKASIEKEANITHTLIDHIRMVNHRLYSHLGI